MKTKQKKLRLPKKRIRRILVPLDGSKFSSQALEFAINLSKYTGSKITGLFIIPSEVPTVPLEDLLNPLSKIKPVGYEAKMSRKAERIMKKAKNVCHQNKIEFSEIILVGSPGHDIVRYSEEKKNGIGLIIMGSRGHGHANELLLGSVSYHVVHKSKKPVMIIN